VSTKLSVLTALLLAPLVLLHAANPEPRWKPPIVGLVAMGDIRFHRVDGDLAQPTLDDLNRVPGIFGGVIINVTWEQLEARSGVLDTKICDDVLAKIRISTHGYKNHTVRTEQWRYIRYAEGGEELYDETPNPYEWTNLATKPEHAATKASLAKFLRTHDAPHQGDGSVGTTDEDTKKKKTAAKE
jgi:hypothetical protein